MVQISGIDIYIVSHFFNVDFLWQDLGSRESWWELVTARGIFFPNVGSRRPVSRFVLPDMFLIPTLREGSTPHRFEMIYQSRGSLLALNPARVEVVIIWFDFLLWKIRMSGTRLAPYFLDFDPNKKNKTISCPSLAGELTMSCHSSILASMI